MTDVSEDKTFSRRGKRFRARMRAVALMFEAEMRDIDPVDLAVERQQMGEESSEIQDVAPYTSQLVKSAAGQLDRIDDLIAEHLRGWTLERIPGVDRAILRIAITELLGGGDGDVDSAIVIDQAIALSADLSTDTSPSYIHAVLDQISALTAHIKAAERALSAVVEPVSTDGENVSMDEDIEGDLEDNFENKADDNALRAPEPTSPLSDVDHSVHSTHGGAMEG